MKSLYSYFQYHCNPIAFIVIAGAITSSHKYNNINDGKAITNKTTAGNIVHIISIVCPCNIYLYGNGFLKPSRTILYNTQETNVNINTK
jgi:hypothetical protein